VGDDGDIPNRRSGVAHGKWILFWKLEFCGEPAGICRLRQFTSTGWRQAAWEA